MRSTKVAQTIIEPDITVSTVQLPPNMSYGNPFETMIFSDDNDVIGDYQTRSATLDEALLAHIDAIAFVIKENKIGIQNRMQIMLADN